LVSFSTQPVSHLPSRLTVARFVRCNGLQFGCWIHRAMCDKEIVWFAAVLHRFSLVDVGAYVQVHAASLAREIRRKWSYLRMQAGTLLLHRVRLSPTRVAILGRQKPIWQWVPKWQQLAFWLDLQQSMQTSSPQTLAVGSRRRADT